MKKILLLTTFFISSLTLNAQEFTYGLTYGSHINDIEIKGPLSAGTGIGYLDIGGFVDYQISDNIGIKTYLIYSNYTEESYSLNPSNTTFIELYDSKVSAFQIRPTLKFDVNRDYNKGFYLLAGPRLSIILNAKDDNDNEIEDLYKGSQLGLQFGFGTIFLKHFSFEIVGDYGLDFIDQDEKSRTTGAYANFSINLESIINN